MVPPIPASTWLEDLVKFVVLFGHLFVRQSVVTSQDLRWKKISHYFVDDLPFNWWTDGRTDGRTKTINDDKSDDIDDDEDDDDTDEHDEHDKHNRNDKNDENDDNDINDEHDENDEHDKHDEHDENDESS